jgi:hypothetical protein
VRADDQVTGSADCPEDEDWSRTLDGHRFVPFAIVDWAFTDSRFGSTTSNGSHRIVHTSNVLERSTSTRTRRLSLVSFGQTFDGSAAVLPWLGLHLRATGASVLGTTRESAVVVGAQSLFSTQAGVTVGLFRAPTVQISAIGDLGWGRNEGITPSLLPDSPHIDRNVWSARPAVAAAIALDPIGIQASSAFELHDIENQADLNLRWVAAAGVSYAIEPVMLLAGANYAHVWRGRPEPNLATLLGRSDNQWNVELGAFYHGRNDLDLGVAFLLSIDDGRGYLGYLQMNYYFD